MPDSKNYIDEARVRFDPETGQFIVDLTSRRGNTNHLKRTGAALEFADGTAIQATCEEDGRVSLKRLGDKGKATFERVIDTERPSDVVTVRGELGWSGEWTVREESPAWAG